MHMADVLVSPVVGSCMMLAAAGATSYSIRKIRKDKSLEQKIPLMGVLGAFIFAAQMINFTIPGTGSSGHITGGILLSAILGPYAGFLILYEIIMQLNLWITYITVCSSGLEKNLKNKK